MVNLLTKEEINSELLNDTDPARIQGHRQGIRDEALAFLKGAKYDKYENALHNGGGYDYRLMLEGLRDTDVRIVLKDLLRSYEPGDKVPFGVGPAGWNSSCIRGSWEALEELFKKEGLGEIQIKPEEARRTHTEIVVRSSGDEIGR